MGEPHGTAFRFPCGRHDDDFEAADGFFASGSDMTSEPYWPGMWIHYRRPADRKEGQAPAFIKVRGDSRGRDFHVLDIKEFGWWTLGMTLTPDGQVHYYASPGVDPLTAQDYLTSQYPYSFRAERFRTFFFNVCNRNDGRTWSTPFVIDDPQLFLVNASRVQSIVDRKRAGTATQLDRQEEQHELTGSGDEETVRIRDVLYGRQSGIQQPVVFQGTAGMSRPWPRIRPTAGGGAAPSGRTHHRCSTARPWLAREPRSACSDGARLRCRRDS